MSGWSGNWLSLPLLEFPAGCFCVLRKETGGTGRPGAQEHTALLYTYGLHSQPDQAVEEVIKAQLEFLVCIPEDNQLQKVLAELEACGKRGGMAIWLSPAKGASLG